METPQAAWNQMQSVDLQRRLKRHRGRSTVAETNLRRLRPAMLRRSLCCGRVGHQPKPESVLGGPRGHPARPPDDPMSEASAHCFLLRKSVERKVFKCPGSRADARFTAIS